MTIDRLEFDGDCHASVSYFIAMTGNSLNSKFVYLLTKTDMHIIINRREAAPHLISYIS